MPFRDCLEGDFSDHPAITRECGIQLGCSITDGSSHVFSIVVGHEIGLRAIARGYLDPSGSGISVDHINNCGIER